MIYIPRTKPYDLAILEKLRWRLSLSDKSRQHFTRLQKGYEGELDFDSFTEELHSYFLILNGLLLSSRQTTFQIDSLILQNNHIYLYEIKNNSGDYCSLG